MNCMRFLGLGFIMVGVILLAKPDISKIWTWMDLDVMQRLLSPEIYLKWWVRTLGVILIILGGMMLLSL